VNDSEGLARRGGRRAGLKGRHDDAAVLGYSPSVATLAATATRWGPRPTGSQFRRRGKLRAFVLKAAESTSDSPNMATPGRLDALFDLSRKLAACLDLDDVLREVGLCASALTGAHAVSLERYDREARALVAFGSGAPAVDADTEAARRVLKTHEPELVEGPAGSSLLAALVSRGESVGVMRIRYNEHHEFAAHEVEFFRSLADVVASAIANALLYARLTRDISERERAEKELRAAEWRYRKLVEDMPVGTYVNSLEGRMTTSARTSSPCSGTRPRSGWGTAAPCSRPSFTRTIASGSRPSRRSASATGRCSRRSTA
jgi:PAS domain-containing protein